MPDSVEQTPRPLDSGDLDAVVEIDREIVGRSRRGFFEKRLEAALAVPDDFVIVGVDEGSELKGYAFARLQSGEFGIPARFATIDAIGVAPDRQSRGIGRKLLDALDARLGRKGVGEIRTQADWRFHGLLRFFDAAGFVEGPTHVLERPTTPNQEEIWRPTEAAGSGDEELADYGEVVGADYGSGAGTGYREPSVDDEIEFRPLRAGDLDSVVRIDRRITGRDRRDYYEHKFREMLDGTGIRVSRVAEIDGDVVGAIMARVDYGEYGRAEPAAVMDTIDVDQGYRHRGVGRALMAQLVVDVHRLHVGTVRTMVPWNNFELLAFLEACGFAPSQRLAFRRTVPA